jgi:coenzyme F420-0:L-glutamate ligase/coenzyme F420-1:gamma-L-glutamate ligase
MLNAIYERRSHRRYRPELVPRHLITQIITAATWAPSAHNRQPWRFVVIETRTQKHTLAHAMADRLRQDLRSDGVPEEAIRKDTNRSINRMVSAPVLILMCLTMEDMDRYPDQQRAENEYLMAVQSTAMAGQNLMLAAHELGLSTCWMCAPLFCPDVVRQSLGLPSDWIPQGLLTLGYAAQERSKDRRHVDESTIWR